MNLSSIWQHFLENVQYASLPEWISVITQIASVWYAKKNNVLVYPTGIIGVLIAFYLYLFAAHPPLYADSILNLYYFAMSVYGWYLWSLKRQDQTPEYPISWCTNKERIRGVVIFILGFFIILYLLVNLTNSNTPVWDALLSSSAVTSMWWMAKRKMENWIAWILSNAVAIPLNFYKGFMLYTFMYILFMGLSVSGMLEWNKKMKLYRER
jgi:nicotinamide mononucleotide transporter